MSAGAVAAAAGAMRVACVRHLRLSILVGWGCLLRQESYKSSGAAAYPWQVEFVRRSPLHASIIVS